MMQFDRVLKEGEQVLWTGQSKFGPTVVDRLTLLLIIGLFGWFMLLMPVLAFYFSPQYDYPSNKFEYVLTDYNLYVLVGAWFACQLPIIAVFFWTLFTQDKTGYAITNHRILFQKPRLNGSIDIIAYGADEIKDMQLNRGLVDMLFGGGSKSILFSTPGSYVKTRKYGTQFTPKRIEHVQNAEEVLRIFQSPQASNTDSFALNPLGNLGSPPTESQTSTSEFTPLNSDIQSPMQPIAALAPASPFALNLEPQTPSSFVSPVLSNLQPAEQPEVTQSTFLPNTVQDTAPISTANLPSEISSILRPDEQVLWQGKPKPWPFVLHFLVLNVGLALYLSLSIWAYVSNPDLLIQNLDQKSFMYFVIGVVVLFGSLVYRALVHAKVWYIVTNQRAIVMGGLIGTDLEVFERSQISKVQIKGGFLNTVIGRGSATVVLDTFNRQHSSRTSPWWSGNEFQHIAGADKVQQLLKPGQ